MTFQLRSEDGYSAEAVVTTYSPARVSNLPALPFSGRNTISTCDANPSTDLAIPVSVEVTNTTANFPVKVTYWPRATRFDVDSWPKSPEYDSSAYRIDGYDTSCVQGSPQSLTVWSSLQPNATGTDDFFVLLPNYYTPAKPNGDPAFLRTTCVDVGVSLGDPPTFTRKEPDTFVEGPMPVVPAGRCRP